MSNKETAYRHNHYVPIWYQKRFMLSGQDKYYRLDLYPDKIKNQNKTRKNLHLWSPNRIFAQDDLYTTLWRGELNTDIEKFFFGKLDNDTAPALNHYAKGAPLSKESDHAFHTLLRYMSVQKLRTPKGLAYVSDLTKTKQHNQILILLQELQEMYCAIWSECVWQIADASDSPTKFIISDHPVTVYNRACPHASKWCRKHKDPDIRMHATHTYFPLSIDKVLIFTNLSWVRNPYQNEIRYRPNRNLFRQSAPFKITSIQTDRKLSEDEVIQINLITKRRAYRYIAAANEEWLYPEKYVSIDYWKKFGDGYLFMPEPRLLYLGGTVTIGYGNGHGESFSEYGHKPCQKGYKDEHREERERKSFYRFQAEWALLKGAQYLAKNTEFGDHGIIEDSAEDMERYKKVIGKNKKKKR